MYDIKPVFKLPTPPPVIFDRVDEDMIELERIRAEIEKKKLILM
jgi:hypothetical protein